jgi:hypothetical protein
MSDSGSGTARAVAAKIAPMLGWERAIEVVNDAMRRLGLKDGTLTADDTTTILEDLTHEAGLVGVTARYALSRAGSPSGSRSDLQAMQPPSSRPAPDAGAAALLVATIGVHELLGQLAALMGEEKAEAVVQAALKRLALPRDRLDREQTTRLLDDLCRQEGHVGTTARFIRPRVMAKFTT